jgi:hypothetical protein
MPEDDTGDPVAICSCAADNEGHFACYNVYVLFVVQKVMRLLKLVHEKRI